MLNFIFWVILIYFALRLIWRYVVPFLLKRTLRKFERQFSGQAHQPYDQSREGEVKIDYIPEKDPTPSNTKEPIEYTDFEDITDKPAEPTV